MILSLLKCFLIGQTNCIGANSPFNSKPLCCFKVCNIKILFTKHRTSSASVTVLQQDKKIINIISCAI